jgi:hypothetical protein
MTSLVITTAFLITSYVLFKESKIFQSSGPRMLKQNIYTENSSILPVLVLQVCLINQFITVKVWFHYYMYMLKLDFIKFFTDKHHNFHLLNYVKSNG